MRPEDGVRGERRLGKAWRNAGFAALAIGALVVGTQGVLSATKAMADPEPAACGTDLTGSADCRD